MPGPRKPACPMCSCPASAHCRSARTAAKITPREAKRQARAAPFADAMAQGLQAIGRAKSAAIRERCGLYKQMQMHSQSRVDNAIDRRNSGHDPEKRAAV